MAADTSDPALKAAVEEVKNPKGATNWVLFTYDKQTVKLKVMAKGDGGLPELAEEINDGKILYGFIRYTIKGVNKFVYLTWCGEGVIGMMKGRFNNHCKDVERFLTGSFHVQINARTEKDLDDNAIKARLEKAMGANFDAGQKEQGQKKGGVTSVQEGMQKVQNPKARPVQKIDQGNVGLDQRQGFWNKQQEEEERVKAQREKAAQRQDPSAVVGARNQFWAQQPEQKTPDRPARPEYNVKAQSEEYWEQANAEEEQRKQHFAGKAKPAAVTGGAARNIKAAFEQKAQPEPVPARAPPPARKPAPPPPAPVYEEPPAQEEEQQWEQPAEEQPVEEQPAEEQPAEEQQWEQPAEEQPAEEQYEQPAEEQPAAGGQQARATYDYAGEQEGDLGFAVGDIINILDTSDPSGWWQGELNGVTGVFPSNFVELI